ncbi:hypothetical protein POF50_012335 [Streptomyces sp. SL13]|uniref:Uncharacterized protein n=1 Tax=Streptantibioticus silvisoli TaxID=2705255 RepID=A0AA90H8Z0_9ACTN|nr:hypothetical protein [Streptantibioticus silvisoli]MDI5970117.1 hypothetical protein [Streptantibioticus silvisoli]
MSTYSDNGPDATPVTSDDAPVTRYLRLQVELVLEITDDTELTTAALEQIQGDDQLPDAERDRSREAVRRDESEALAYLVDPFDLVNGVPGVDLVQASWNSAHIEYDPDDEEWEFFDDEAEDEDEPVAGDEPGA